MAFICLHNQPGGTIRDVTEKVGIHREKGCVGVTFVDYDHDGDLDLYITTAVLGRLQDGRSAQHALAQKATALSRMCPMKPRSASPPPGPAWSPATSTMIAPSISFLPEARRSLNLSESPRRKIHFAPGDRFQKRKSLLLRSV